MLGEPQDQMPSLSECEAIATVHWVVCLSVQGRSAAGDELAALLPL
jgi:hypothetical protein